MTARRSKLQTRNAQAGIRRVPARAVEKRAHVNLATRAASVDVAARTFECIASTETPCRRYVELEGLGYVQADEVLPTEAVDLSAIAGRAPLLDGHDTSSTDSVLGSIESARSEDVDGLGACVVLTCRVSEGPKGDEVLAKLASGALNAVSVGHRVADYEVQVRDGTVPVARALTWTLAEVSLVPVGADPNARVRSADAAPGQPGGEQAGAGEQASGQTAATTDAADPEIDAVVAGLASLTTLVQSLVAARSATGAGQAAQTQTGQQQAATGQAVQTTGQQAVVQETRTTQPVIDTRAILDALQAAGRGDPRVRSIRALAANANAGELGEHCVRMGMTVEQAAATIRAAGIARTESGAEISGRAAPGQEGEPPARPVIDTQAIFARLAAQHQTR